MSIVDHRQSFQVPYSKEHTFTALIIALDDNETIKVDSTNGITYTIIAKAGISLFSWGENITITVTDCINGAEVSVLSTPKTGLYGGGAFDMGKNRKNIELISNILSKELEKGHYPQIIVESNDLKTSISCADEILKLSNLKEKGIITEEEFNNKKAKLLEI